MAALKTRKKKPKVEVPEGFQLLEGGVERRLRINKNFLRMGPAAGPPYYLLTAPEFNKADFYWEVRLLGESEGGIAPENNPKPGEPTHQIFVRTHGPVLVKS